MDESLDDLDQAGSGLFSLSRILALTSQQLSFNPLKRLLSTGDSCQTVYTPLLCLRLIELRVLSNMPGSGPLCIDVSKLYRRF